MRRAVHYSVTNATVGLLLIMNVKIVIHIKRSVSAIEIIIETVCIKLFANVDILACIV